MKSPDHQAKRLIIIRVIKEMQAELDVFFRAKKAKKVKLTSEDVLYLEVMLAQAIGANPRPPNTPTSGNPESMLSGFAQRFLQEFFTLKTKPQVQLKESTFKMVKSMVDHTVSRALSQVKRELCRTDDEVIVYETDEENHVTENELSSSVPRYSRSNSSSSVSSELSLSRSSDTDVQQEASPKIGIFQTGNPRSIVKSCLLRTRKCKINFTKGANSIESDNSSIASSEDIRWLSRGSVALYGVTPESPIQKNRVSIASLCSYSSSDESNNQIMVEPRRLPIKKRRPSTEAVVPNLRGNNPSPNMS